MIQFIRVGSLWLNVSEVRAIQQDRDGGEVVLHYGGRCEPVSADDGKALIEWAESNLVIASQKIEARAVKAKAKTEADATKHKEEKK